MTGTQEAVLTIRLAQMKTIIGSPTLIYKCTAKSTQFLNAPNSIDVDVVATVHDPSFGEYSITTVRINLPPRSRFRTVNDLNEC